MGPPPMPGSPRSPKSPRRSGGSSPFVQTAMEISPALVLAVVAALAALAVGALDLTHEVTLGIDLGTTYSVAATCDKGEVSVVVDDAIGSMGAVGGDAATVPSVVHFERPAFALARDEWRSKRWGEFGSRVGTKRELNERKREFKSRREVKSANDAAVVEVGSVVGAEAAALRDAVPALTVYDAKRLIGREFDDPVVQEELEHLPFHVVENHNQPRPRDAAIGATMQGKALPYKRLMPSDRANLVVIPPEEVGARILSHLKRHSERSLPFFRRNLGFAFGSLTVSVPVGFTKAQRAATLRAANRAGFATARLLEEPVAAAIAYGLHEDDVERTVLVYDLGGGTLDVAVLRLERSSRTFLVLGTSGDPHLGGEDFDRALVGWLWRELRTDGFRAPADDDDGRWEETALRVMERAKRGLAESERVGVRACGDEDAYPTGGRRRKTTKREDEPSRWRICGCCRWTTIRRIQRRKLQRRRIRRRRIRRRRTRRGWCAPRGGSPATTSRRRAHDWWIGPWLRCWTRFTTRGTSTRMRLTTSSSSADRPGSRSSGRGSARRSTAGTFTTRSTRTPP